MMSTARSSAPSLANLARARLAQERAKESTSSTELAAYVARYKDDYEGFCPTLEIRQRDGKLVPFVFNTTQRAYTKARTPRDYVLKGRRVGMTTEALARDLHHFLTHDGADVLVVCQSSMDGGAIRTVAGILEPMLAAVERVVPLEFTVRSQNEWRLANGNHLRIIGAGASLLAANKKGRAGAITRLHCTEIAFWEFAGATLIGLLECVAGPQFGTEIQFESTPNGSAGDVPADKGSASGAAWFHWGCQDASAARSEYAFHFFDWWLEPEHAIDEKEGEDLTPVTEREKYYAPKLTPAQFRFYRSRVQEKGTDKTDQEYPPDPVTCFLVSGRKFFDKLTVAALVAKRREPIDVLEHGALRIFKQPERGGSYVIGADTSEGGGGDPSAALVYERGTGEHVATIHEQFIPHDFAAILARTGLRYNTAAIAVERNNHGHAVLQALAREQEYPNIYKHRDEKPGWLTGPTTRSPMLDAMDAAMRSGAWRSPDKVVLDEANTFVINAKGKAEAQRGNRDDLIIAGAIGWAVLALPLSLVEDPPTAVDDPSRWGSQEGRGFG